MAIVQPKKVRVFRVDRGNNPLAKTHVTGKVDDRAFILVKNGEDGKPYVAERAVAGIIGNFIGIESKTIKSSSPKNPDRVMLQIILYDEQLGMTEVAELGNIYSMTSRNALNLISSVIDQGIYGLPLKISTWKNTKGDQTYTNVTMYLDGVKLSWKYSPSELDAKYPKKPILDENGDVVMKPNGQPKTAQDVYFDNLFIEIQNKLEEQKASVTNNQTLQQDSEAIDSDEYEEEFDEAEELPF